jgi:hypothetical protein
MRRPYLVLITRLKRQPYLVLIIGLGLSAIAAVIGALVFLHSSHMADVNAELGKWLLTVAAALVFSGALTMVVKEIDQRRSKRQAWHGVLHDLVAANHTVAMVRLYLKAERSVLTYQEQLAEFVRARLELRRISDIDIVIADPPLREHINEMRRYLEAVGDECETGYLRVARQQRLDEVWLTNKIKAANGSAGAPMLPDELAKPTKAWDMLMDKAWFPRVAALLDDHAFRIDAFRIHYKLAKRLLEIHAGFGDRSMDAWTFLARRLAQRAMEFLEQHKDDLAADIRRCVEMAARNAEYACARTDSGAIRTATDKLCQATALAILAVYPSPGRRAPRPGEREEHPAPSSASPQTVGTMPS